MRLLNAEHRSLEYFCLCHQGPKETFDKNFALDSSGRVHALQARSPELKPQFYQKKKKALYGICRSQHPGQNMPKGPKNYGSSAQSHEK
jgi:hypothetical protein